MGPKSRSGGVGSGWLSQTSPIPRSPDGDNDYQAMFIDDQEIQYTHPHTILGE